jgi:hypothetical protein
MRLTSSISRPSSESGISKNRSSSTVWRVKRPSSWTALDVMTSVYFLKGESLEARRDVGVGRLVWFYCDGWLAFRPETQPPRKRRPMSNTTGKAGFVRVSGMMYGLVPVDGDGGGWRRPKVMDVPPLVYTNPR